MADRSVITGRVLDVATGAGIAGLRVEALDSAGLFRDLLGFARTDADGRFRMEELRSDLVALVGMRAVVAYLRVIHTPSEGVSHVLVDTRQSGPKWALDGTAASIVLRASTSRPLSRLPALLPFVVSGAVHDEDGPMAGVTVQLFDRDGLPSGWQVGYAALAGMHIINKAQPEWVWITFENVYNPQFTAAKLELPLSADVVAANQQYQGLLAGNVFANYQLDGVQTTFTEPGSPSQPTLLANSTIESIFQQQSSCITCHSLASISAKGEYFNLAYTEGGNLNYYVGNPPSLAGYNFLDYVWSMKRASRQRSVALLAPTATPQGPETYAQKEGAK